MNLKRPTQIELNQMSHAEKDALILMLFDLLEHLEKRLQIVEQKTEKNSQNSSKPPSSDGLKKAPAQPRNRGEKPVGGQKGHKGQTLEMTEQPDVIEYCLPQGDCECGLSIEQSIGEWVERRQQSDIPKPKIVVTEFWKMATVCRCGRRHEGEFPSHVSRPVSYGLRLKAYATGLIHGHFVSIKRTTEIINDQYGIKPSTGTLQNWSDELAAALATQYEEQRQQLIKAAVVNFDESGLRAEGRLHWLHVAANQDTVVYSCQTKRGYEGVKAAGILPAFKGIAVHDCWSPYWRFDGITHALCNAHLLRELNYFEQTIGEAWISEFKDLFIVAKKAVETAQQAKKTQLEPAELAEFKQQYQQLYERGLKNYPEEPPIPGKKGRQKQHPATNLLKRLKTHQDAVLRFLEDWRVPFDNNRAERAVRCIKVKLKVIGGFRVMMGAQAFCVIRSIWETAKLREQNPFEVFRMAF